MKKLILSLAAFTFLAGTAFADCTPENIQTKMTDLQAKVQKIIQKDPTKATEWQNRMMDWLTEGKDVKPEDACDYIDGFVKKIESEM